MNRPLGRLPSSRTSPVVPTTGVMIFCGLVLSLALLVVLIGCGRDGEGDRRKDEEIMGTTSAQDTSTSTTTLLGEDGEISYSSDPQDLVFRMEESGGLLPPQTAYSQLPTFSLYGDGTVLVRPEEGDSMIPPAVPKLVEANISERAVERILMAVRDAGLLDPLDGYGRPPLEDAPTTTFIVRADGEMVELDIYALGYESSEPDGDLTREQAEAREAIVDLRSRLFELSNLLGEEIQWNDYEYSALHVFVLPNGNAGPDLLAWPIGALAEMGSETENSVRHAVLGTVETSALRPVLEEADMETGWVSGSNVYRLAFRPLLPDEDPSGISKAEMVGLPAPVERTRSEILAAARTDDVQALSAIAEEGDDDFTYSFGGPVLGGPEAFWNEQIERGTPVISTLTRILLQPWAYDDLGHYVWPFAHAWDWNELDDAHRATLGAYYSSDQIADWTEFGGYTGYRVGISADGDWLFYVAGD